MGGEAVTAAVLAGPALSARARAIAIDVGFDEAGIATLGPMPGAARLREWIERGFHGEMSYLERGAALREDTTRPEPGMRSAIVVLLDYGGHQPPGAVARYARGDDYHDVMRSMLRTLHARLENELGAPFAARPYVDTGPVLERELAVQAGLGWIGKNTMLVNPQRGSFFFIGALFTALDLAPDTPFRSDHCGTCTRCIDACPTSAIVEPRVLDATTCISYLTIEHRSAIPESLRPAMGEHVFGCDICQDVCPWNVKFAAELPSPRLHVREDRMSSSAAELLQFDDDGFRARFRGSAVTRAKRRGLARNAAIALGNGGDRCSDDELVALRSAAASDPDEMVREHAAWALHRVEETE
jgi:epoxyqueuosine reductase